MKIADQLADLVDLDSDQYRLTDWEVEFVDSVEKQTRGGRSMSLKQEQIVSRIYDDVFIHGKRTAL